MIHDLEGIVHTSDLHPVATNELQNYVSVYVKGQWMYLYRAVDKAGNTIDFLLSPNRKRQSAHAFLIKAIKQNGVPSLINIDKSGANKAGIKVYSKRNWKKIKWRQQISKQHCGAGSPVYQMAYQTNAGIQII